MSKKLSFDGNDKFDCEDDGRRPTEEPTNSSWWLLRYKNKEQRNWFFFAMEIIEIFWSNQFPIQTRVVVTGTGRLVECFAFF